MESSITINSKDRVLFGIVIKQETESGFLSITELQKAYEVARWQYGWGEINIASLMQSEKMLERIYYLLQSKEIVKVEFSTFTKMCKDEGITKVLKGLNCWKTTRSKDNKGVMCNPYIWVAIALELNPMIYAKVVNFITDSLIFDRIDAGDGFRPMNNAIKSIIKEPDYKQYAMAINQKVFGQHMTGIRNLASASELRSIAKIEELVKSTIEMGLITNNKQIMMVINK